MKIIMKCKAKSKQSGTQCKRYASIGREVCRIHGGATPKGIESKSFKHGRNSKYLPDKLATRFQDFDNERNCGRLSTLDEQIDLVYLRISILCESLDSGNSLSAWKIVDRSFKKLKDAVHLNDPKKFQNALCDFEEAIKTGKDDFYSWNELVKAQDHLRKLLSSERKRMIDEGYMLSINDVLLILSAIGEIINRTIKDKEKLREIRTELHKLANQLGLIN